MSSVIAHQLMDESIEIDVDGVPENTQSTLTLSRDGEMEASFAPMLSSNSGRSDRGIKVPRRKVWLFIIKLVLI